jgi:hypothetical protein
MTVDVDDSEVIKIVTEQHINEVPKFQRDYVVSQINSVCQGKASYWGALAEIHRRYGQRIRNSAKKILDGILLELAVPTKIE